MYDALHLSKLSNIINSCFGVTETVRDIVPVKSGVNSRNYGSHFEALTQSGISYGLKISVRGVASGTENEKLLADIGELLMAPNVCPVRLSQHVDMIPLFAGKLVNITRWLADSKQIKTLSDTEKSAIGADFQDDPFFYQFGQWTAFGLFFGLKDRHEENWVWASQKRQLTMIDLEDGLVTVPLTEYGRRELMLLATTDPDVKKTHRQQLIRGFNRMYGKAARQRTAIDALLASYGHARSYKLQHFGLARTVLNDYLLAYWS